MRILASGKILGARVKHVDLAQPLAPADFRHPEVMLLSNIVIDGKAIGPSDAGQGWHTDMSYSKEIALANVLHAMKVPVRAGRSLGAVGAKATC